MVSTSENALETAQMKFRITETFQNEYSGTVAYLGEISIFIMRIDKYAEHDLIITIMIILRPTGKPVLEIAENWSRLVTKLNSLCEG